MSLSWLRVVIIGAALAVAAIVGVLSTGSADVWPTLWLALIAVGGLVAAAAVALLAKKLASSTARYVASRRVTLRSLLAAGGAFLVIAIVGLLAFNTYAILNENGWGSLSPHGPESAPSVPLSPEAQGTPTCAPGQVYMPGLERCVSAPMSCAPSERWDSLRERCVPDIPEPLEPAAPSYSERRCQEAQAELTDALAELAVEQAKLTQCQGPDPPPIGCMFIQSDVDRAIRDAETARSSFSVWCR